MDEVGARSEIASTTLAISTKQVENAGAKVDSACKTLEFASKKETSCHFLNLDDLMFSLVEIYLYDVS